MAFHRCVLVIEKKERVSEVLSLALQVAPNAKQWTVVTRVGLSWFHWFRDDPWSELEGWVEQGENLLASMRKKLPDERPELDVEVFSELSPAVIANVAKSMQADLILSSSLSLLTTTHPLSWYFELAKDVQVPLLVAKAEAASWFSLGLNPQPSTSEQPSPEAPLTRWLCLCQRDFRQTPELAALLHQHTSSKHQVLLLDANEDKDSPTSEDSLKEWGTLVGVEATLSLQSMGVQWFRQIDALTDFVKSNRLDLVVVALDDVNQSLWGLPLFSQYALSQVPAPVLFLPPQHQEIRQKKELFAADSVLLGESMPVYVEQPEPLGLGVEPFAGDLELLHQGETCASLNLLRGCAWTQASMEDDVAAFGLTTPVSTGFADAAVSALQTTFRLLRPSPRPLVLFDTTVKEATLQRLFHKDCSLVQPVAVRVRRGRSLGRIRETLAALTDTSWVLDASQILDDGYPTDLPYGTTALRLMRVALRLRAAGYHVVALVVPHQQHIQPTTFAVWEESMLTTADDAAVSALMESVEKNPTPHSEQSMLDTLSQSQVLAGNKVELLPGNRQARETFLQLVDDANERIHLQAYIIHDDSVTQLLESALRRASERGVTIRLLVDSLYSMHGSFGIQNEWLQRVSQFENVTVHLFRPIDEVPGLEDLKQRDHRKFLIVDGEKAVVTGRNLAHTYYTDFDEVTIAPDMSEDLIPWLDAGVVVQGPVAEAVDASFLSSWQKAGGEPFALHPQEPKGTLDCRLVQHVGLRDTYTLDAHLEMIRQAQHQITLVNTFPLQQEVLHTLLQALRRGVDVRVLIGNVRPLFNERKPFSGNPLRSLATQVVLSRIDPLVKAGASAYEYALPHCDSWSSEIEQLLPHVHAKILTCDNRLVGLGSANFDITGGFWESEVLLVVDDEDFAATMNKQIFAWIETSLQVQPYKDEWQRDAAMREWLNRVWPSIIA
ncbi:MAG: phosphatidylserine/phosphatidylglycerophosphate/cardiolipin synthase family protein [Deltaproteobacteria bacterium]|nr:MAG: phosphatidylserine/phosphatidylglycerophosphate/cardiolipin synthase family protein [Deltaproteobacteria bacterium]